MRLLHYIIDRRICVHKENYPIIVDATKLSVPAVAVLKQSGVCQKVICLIRGIAPAGELMQ